MWGEKNHWCCIGEGALITETGERGRKRGRETERKQHAGDNTRKTLPKIIDFENKRG